MGRFVYFSVHCTFGLILGDVKLNNLEVKETALDELDLPIKLKFGYLSSLVLKIPWKNLYTEPVIANIEGLYLIVVPNKGVVYNEDKTQKNVQDTKQKALARLEENRKNRRKPKDPAADTFAEKMVAQVIKNLQIKIKNIHIRFEDKYSNRHRPFAAGITLDELDFQTTDENWKPMILKETVKIFHKLVSMKNLAIYWNSDCKFYSDMDTNDEIRNALKESIADQKKRPDNYKYSEFYLFFFMILDPFQFLSRLRLRRNWHLIRNQNLLISILRKLICKWTSLTLVSLWVNSSIKMYYFFWKHKKDLDSLEDI